MAASHAQQSMAMLVHLDVSQPASTDGGGANGTSGHSVQPLAPSVIEFSSGPQGLSLVHTLSHVVSQLWPCIIQSQQTLSHPSPGSTCCSPDSLSTVSMFRRPSSQMGCARAVKRG